jgi:hypothetical protein
VGSTKQQIKKLLSLSCEKMFIVFMSKIKEEEEEVAEKSQ